VGAIPGSPLGAALGRLVAQVASNALPGPQDYQALIPPTSAAWVRRVPGENMWLWFRFDDAAVTLVTLTTSPPAPFTESR
jgi:hypothetical protein